MSLIEELLKNGGAHLKSNPLVQIVLNSLLSSNGSLLNAGYDNSLSLGANLQRAYDNKVYKESFGEILSDQTNRYTDDLLYNIYTKGFGYSSQAATDALNSEGMRFITGLASPFLSANVNRGLSSVYQTAYQRRYLAGAGGDRLTNMAKFANVTRVMGERMMDEHFINHSFGNLDLADVGTVYSSLMSSGKYDAIGGIITDKTSNDEVERIASTRATKITQDAKQYSKALSTLKDTLGGSIKEIIDNVESLFQTNIGSISPQQLQNMANNIAHSTAVTNVGAKQLSAMAGTAYSYIAPYGGDAMIANQIAVNSAYSMSSSPLTYGLSADKYKAAALAMHTNKVLTGDTQYMSAAYQAWADKNNKDAGKQSSYDEFLQDLRANNVDMTSAGFTNYMTKTLGRSASDVTSLVQSEYTGRLSAQFNMTGAMFTQQYNALNDRRAAYFTKTFGKEFVEGLGGKDAIGELTDDNVRDAVYNHLKAKGVSNEEARRQADNAGRYMLVSARAALGNTMGEKESAEFMRQQASAERGARAKLLTTGMMQLIRDDADLTTAGGLEGIAQLIMGKKGDINLSSVVSVGLLGVDLTEAANALNNKSAEESTAYITDKIDERYELLFGKAPDKSMTPEQRYNAVRNKIVTEYQDSSTFLNARRSGKSTLTDKEFQQIQANAVTTMAVLRRDTKNKKALEDIKAYVNNGELDVSETLKYAVNNNMIADMYTEDGRERIQSYMAMDEQLDKMLAKGDYAKMSEEDRKKVRTRYRSAAQTLSALDGGDRAALKEAMRDGKLSKDELKSIDGLSKEGAAQLQQALDGKTGDAAKDVFDQLMKLSGSSDGQTMLWDTLFALLREIASKVG